MKILSKIATLGAVAALSQTSLFRRKPQAVVEEEPIACDAPCPACETCPLSSLRVGQACYLQGVGAGPRLRRRLAELGLTPGVELTVLQNTGGPVMVCVRNSRLALGRQMAHQLDVLPLPVEEI